MKHIEYKTKGTCSRSIIVEIEEGVIRSCKFVGGCAGNTQGVAVLVKGMRVEDAIERLSGIQCGFRGTSCPDQLSRALRESLDENV